MQKYSCGVTSGVFFCKNKEFVRDIKIYSKRYLIIFFQKAFEKTKIVVYKE